MKRPPWLYLFFSFLILLLFLAGLETIQRIRHPYVGFRNMRNSLGFRSPEFNPQKKTGTVRILFIGSSTTFGTNAPVETTFPFLVGESLKKQIHDAPIEVINAAEPCKTAAWEVQRMRETLYLKPDIMVVMTGYNDSVTVYSDLARAGESGSLTLLPWYVALDTFIAHYSVFYVTLREKIAIYLHGKPDYAFDPPTTQQEVSFDHSNWLRQYPADFRKKLEQMINLCASHGIKLIFIKPPISPQRRKERPNHEIAYRKLMEALASAAAEHKIPVIDLDDLYPDTEWRDYVAVDGLHFTDKGNAEIAKRVTEYFIQHKKYYF